MMRDLGFYCGNLERGISVHLDIVMILSQMESRTMARRAALARISVAIARGDISLCYGLGMEVGNGHMAMGDICLCYGLGMEVWERGHGNGGRGDGADLGSLTDWETGILIHLFLGYCAIHTEYVVYAITHPRLHHGSCFTNCISQHLCVSQCVEVK